MRGELQFGFSGSLFGDSLLISLSKLCPAEAMPEISKLSPKRLMICTPVRRHHPGS
jgi:hypothetical protein